MTAPLARSALPCLILSIAGPAWAGGATPYSPPTDANCQAPRWSPDGARLAWERNDHAARSVEIWLGAPDTPAAPPARVAPMGGPTAAPAGFQTRPAARAAYGVAWAPLTAAARLRGRFVYATSVGAGDPDLHLLDDPAPLVTGPGADGDAAWSAGAPGRVVFTSARTGGGDLYVLTLGQPEPVRLTTLPDSAEVSPSLSPDGNAVVYVAHTQRGDNLWIIDDLSRPAPRPLTAWTGSQTRPTWSPDGAFIAFYAMEAGDRAATLVVSTPQGQTRTVAEGVVPDSRGPAWTPDGTRLVFVLDRDAELDPVYAAAPGGGAPKRVPIDTVGNTDLSVAVDPRTGGLRLAVAAQGRVTDTVREFHRIYIWTTPSLP
jgi:Tol biopolymer transport system component